MKTLLLAFALVLSSTAFAQEVTCSPDAGEIIASIEATTTCYDASTIAENCAWGSSVDVGIAGAAYDVCLKEAGKLTSADKKLLSTMEKRCEKAWANREGSLYRSAHSFCKLDALKFVNGVANAANN
jgi:hypothetical protein